MLPTEDQWQYAAQGDDGRVYPWGNHFDAKHCNTNESEIGKTSPVRQYAGKGDSPFGVIDMAGNVSEWCVTDYVSKANDIYTTAERRVVRGGSWGSSHDLARVVDRFGRFPVDRDGLRGFRLARS